MGTIDDEKTDGALLERLGDWADHEAWSAFVGRHDRQVRRVVGSYRLGAEASEEVYQAIWIELANRMRGYRYDPSKRFRAWLDRLCRSRAVDHWRRREAERARAGGEPPPTPTGLEAPSPPDDDDPTRQALLRRAERIQEAVKARVDARTWEVFWRIAVDDAPVAEAAEAAGISYAAAFAAQKRVRRMLREEAGRGEAAAIEADAGASP
ncbi:sigma-70 family RNA polymerase sigma factor [Paludisphaera sp.]|uniref:RNA polymerase sigma factor n=1 Tax=Paludisphaera sp. TaxID=2017432 RepID=UPI00301D6462